MINKCLSIASPYAIGVLSFLLFFGIDWAAGIGGPYNWPVGDLTQHIAGAYAYLDGAWQLPLFHTDRINAPTGVNIIFTDSVPFAGLLAKIVYSTTGLRWNYIGTWFFILWVGQAVSAGYFLRQLGVKNWVLIACGSVLALSFPAFLYRHGHLALSSHFLIILALALYVKGSREGLRRSIQIQWNCLLIVSLFTHAYLFIMCFAIFIAEILQESSIKKTSRKSVLRFVFCTITIIFILAWIGGYFTSGSNGRATGYDVYSMNLLSPFSPLMSLFFGGGYPATTGGQYEGFNYLGAAGLFMLACAILVLRGNIIKKIVLTHPYICLTLIAMAAYAVSSSIWLGEHHLLSLPTPNFPPFNIFRASGRFFWPLGYALVLGSFAVLSLGMSKHLKFFIPTAIALTSVQSAESINLLRNITNIPHSEPKPIIANAVAHSKFVQIVPPWECTLGDPNSSQLVGEIIWLAAKHEILVDTAHVARPGSDTACNISPPPHPSALSIYLPSAKLVPPTECWIAEGMMLCGLLPSIPAVLARAQPPVCKSITSFSETNLSLWSSGLSVSQGWGRRAEGKQARVQCTITSGKAKSVIKLTARGRTPKGMDQPVSISINGETFARESFNMMVKSIEIPFSIVSSNILDIVISVDTPIAQGSISRPDAEERGLDLISLIIE